MPWPSEAPPCHRGVGMPASDFVGLGPWHPLAPKKALDHRWRTVYTGRYGLAPLGFGDHIGIDAVGVIGRMTLPMSTYYGMFHPIIVRRGRKMTTLKWIERSIIDRRITVSVSQRPGFTLTEAIVLVGVFSVLGVCVVSSASGARGNSKSSTCLNNLSRIGHANLIYAAQDPSDPALPVHRLQLMQDPNDPSWIGAYEWGGKSGAGKPGFIPGAGGDNLFLTSRYGTKAGFGPASRPLNDILYAGGFADYSSDGPNGFVKEGAIADTQLDLGFNRCPTDNGYTGIHKPAFRDERRTSFDHFGTSYNANLFMTSFLGGGPVFSSSPYLHRLSDIISPATTLAYMENNGRFAWKAAPLASACASLIGGQGVPGTVRGWHGKDWMFNAAFIDGHVGTIHMRGYDIPRVDPDEQNQKRNTCIIVHGDGWQVDTHPLLGAATGLYWDGSGRVSSEGGVE